MGWDKSFSNNLRVGYEIAKGEYNNALNRFKELDNKLNMMLVFAACEITAFATTLYLFGDPTLKKIYLLVFLVAYLAAVLSIIIGLFIKYFDLIDENKLIEDSNYDEETINFLGGYIKSYVDCIKKIENKIQNKVQAFKAASILICIDLAIFSAFMISNCFI